MSTTKHKSILWAAVFLPLVMTVIYGITLPNVPKDAQKWFNGEHGPVEIIQAAIFLLAAVAAANLARRLPRAAEPIPVYCRAWFWLMALGGLFMFLEEISWGQHLFQWSSPEFFVEHNKQAETNLHNLMSDTPSRLLRRTMEFGFPLFGLVLPLVFYFGHDSWERGHWPRYIMPRFELTVWVVLSVLLRPVRKWIETQWPEQYRSSLSEYQELLWACALMLYVVTMCRRLLAEPTSCSGQGQAAAGQHRIMTKPAADDSGI